MRLISIFVILISLFVSAPTFAEDWLSFRGPSGQGFVKETALPLMFSETENVTWRKELPGKGWSSPVIVGNEIWLSTSVEEPATEAEKAELLKDEKRPKQQDISKSVSLRALCVDKATGQIKHDIELINVTEPESIHATNSYASPTPVIFEDRIVLHFGTYGTYCLERKTGELVWSERLRMQHAVGPGSSPVVWEDLLILVCDGMEDQYVTALNCRSGKTVWKSDRPKMTGDNGDFHKAFSTPLVVEWDGETQVLTPGAQWFVSYAARTGDMIWHINHGKGFSNVAAPVYADGISYLITGFTKPELWAIPMSGRGELTRGNVLWEQTKQVPKKSSPQWTDAGIYMVSDNGVLSCVNADSGELNWSARLGGNYSASPIHCKGRIYFANESGVITVVKPNAEKFEKLKENQLEGQIMASPAVDGRALFIRTDQALYRIEEADGR